MKQESVGDKLAMAIGLAPRRLGKADLALTPDDKARATALRPGLDASEWSIDQAARIAFMAASYAATKLPLLPPSTASALRLD